MGINVIFIYNRGRVKSKSFDSKESFQKWINGLKYEPYIYLAEDNRLVVSEYYMVRLERIHN